MNGEAELRGRLLEAALRAARAGAAVVMEHYRSGLCVAYEEKARNDFVTAVDREAESAITSAIRERFPHHAFLAEEAGRDTAGEEIRWIIDPLDGTTNFIHGFPVFSVSVAAARLGAPSPEVSGLWEGADSAEFDPTASRLQAGARGPVEGTVPLDPTDLVVGVVVDPIRGETFTASRGAGARMNDRPIHVSAAAGLGSCLLATGFPFRVQNLLPAYLKIFEDLNRTTQGIRRPGSAALDLSWVAAGRVDGFFEFGLSPWDIAAGALIVMEAGGIARGFTGRDDYLETGHVVAGPAPITEAILEVIAKHYP
jgi:myo-inositol-1(or 4)-monophosphatase